MELKDYIKKHGYPDENVIFCDSYGRIRILWGKNVLTREIEKYKKMT